MQLIIGLIFYLLIYCLSFSCLEYFHSPKEAQAKIEAQLIPYPKSISDINFNKKTQSKAWQAANATTNSNYAWAIVLTIAFILLIGVFCGWIKHITGYSSTQPYNKEKEFLRGIGRPLDKDVDNIMHSDYDQ